MDFCLYDKGKKNNRLYEIMRFVFSLDKSKISRSLKTFGSPIRSDTTEAPSRTDGGFLGGAWRKICEVTSLKTLKTLKSLMSPLPLGKIKINFVFTLAYSYICPAYQPLVLGGWQSERSAFGITGQCPRMVCLTQRQC